MSVIQSILSVARAGEPASIFYIVTGAVGFAYAGLRKSKSVKRSVPTPLLICDRESQAKLADLNLLHPAQHP
jgi:hypothetical protein